MRYYELITERKKKKRKKTKLARYFFPGFAYYGGTSDSGDAGDGGGGGESMYEGEHDHLQKEIEKFKDWACERLHVKNPPKIELSFDQEEAQNGRHTGRHVEGSDSVWVYANNRNLVDILRTVFHELVHWRQSELNMIDAGDSYPGSAIESMADMLAGKYIKIYGKQNGQIFE